MPYFTQLYTPETFEAFGATNRSITGVRPNQQSMAERLGIGDRLICYMTGFSRWVGVLRVNGKPYSDESPVLFEGDPFTLRIPVEPLVWLDRDSTLPVHEPAVWNALSFTRDLEPGSSRWTGKVKRSLYALDDLDGATLERLIQDQLRTPNQFPIPEDDFQKAIRKPVQRAERRIMVSIPMDDPEPPTDQPIAPIPEGPSAHSIQGSLARIGEAMGYRIWLPRNDRGRVLQNWAAEDDTLLDELPLSWDEATIRTVEQIDVLWIKGRSIRRAFEVEHTTAIYSGLLRMADLLALQGNMQIALHIVAPAERQEAVMAQLSRPVFSLLENAPLSDQCSFLSYESVAEIAALRHLERMTDGVVDDFAESP